MITQLSYKDSIFSRTVNNAVLVVDAPGPVTGKTVFKRFRFACARERIVHDLMNEPVEAVEQYVNSQDSEGAEVTVYHEDDLIQARAKLYKYFSVMGYNMHLK